MPSLFSKIIAGEIPSRMLWEDDQCVSFLDVRPLAPGHALVVPRVEIDQWTDLSTELAAHLMSVAHIVGRAQYDVFAPERIGLVIAGFEIPHAHVHVVPANSMRALDFAQANTDPDQAELDGQLIRLRDALAAAGHDGVSSR